MKIMYLTHTAKMGGAEKSLYNLIKNIDNKIYEPILVCGEEGELADNIRKLGVRVEIIPLMKINTKYKIKGIVRLLITSIKLRSFIKKNNISIVHNNTYRARFFGTISGKISGVKIVTHVRDIMNWTSVEKKLINFENKIISISDAVQKHVVNQINNVNIDKIVRIHNGVDVEEFNPRKLKSGVLREEYKIGVDKFLIGAVGRFEEWKKFDVFIEAAKILKDEYKDLVFFISGGAFDEKQEIIKNDLLKLVERYDLNERVIFTGYRKNISEIMNDLDLFVLTSDNEPFGRVLIEALSLNLPIVSTNNGGAPEIIKDNINGLLVPPNDSKQLAGAIEQMIINTTVANNMRINNRDYAIDNFSIQTHVKLVCKVYEELLFNKEEK